MYIMFLDRYISIYILHIFHVGRNTDGMGWGGGGGFNKKKTFNEIQNSFIYHLTNGTIIIFACRAFL